LTAAFATGLAAGFAAAFATGVAAGLAAGFFAVAMSISLINLQRALDENHARQVIHGVGQVPSIMNGGQQDLATVRWFRYL
jgi:hypothetical protein